MFFSGPSKLLELSKAIENPFWSNILKFSANLIKEASYSNPESFYLFPIWNNPLFKNGRRVFYSPNMDLGTHKLQIVADFFSSPGVPMTQKQLKEKYNVTLSNTQLNKLQLAMETAANYLNFNLGLAEWHCEPRQSIILQIASKSKKGCQTFYKVLRARHNERGVSTRSEDKWHDQLESILSIDFWDKAMRLNASIKYDNFAKWLQFQIIRNSIFTNDRVSKFKPQVGEKCDFCALETENSYHLFYQCYVSQQFWVQVKLYLLKFNIYLPVTRLPILFGIIDQDFNSIWTWKKTKKSQNILFFKHSLAEYLKTIKVCFVIQNLGHIFEDQWGAILLDLLEQDVPCSPLQGPHDH